MTFKKDKGSSNVAIQDHLYLTILEKLFFPRQSPGISTKEKS